MKTSIAKLKFPFTVTTVTSGQDENGNPVEVPTSWSSFCAFSRVSTKQALFAGLDTKVEVAEIRFRYLPEREIKTEDLISVLDRGEWTPYGKSTPDEEGKERFYKQLLKRG